MMILRLMTIRITWVDVVRSVVMMMLKMMWMMRITNTWVDIVRSVVTPRDTRAGIAFWSSQKLT